MICPDCEQSEILNAMIKKTGEKIQICDECDSVWLENKTPVTPGELFRIFMEKRGLPGLWTEIEVLGKA